MQRGAAWRGLKILRERRNERERDQAGGVAVLLLSVDTPVPAAVLEAIHSLPGVKRAMALRF